MDEIHAQTHEQRLRTYLRHVSRGKGSRRAQPAKPNALLVSVEKALRFRAQATSITSRLPGASLAEAAYGALQDSAPRAGLLSLHARVEDVGPKDWADTSLAQIWLRGADYIIPRTDIGVFTLGCLPRNQEIVKALEAACDLLLAGVPHISASESLSRRICQVTGRFLITWDASTTRIIPIDRPDEDPELARLELVRRFLAWYAPATATQCAKWAGISVEDSEETLRRIATELIDVDFLGQARLALRAQEDALRGSESQSATRFLPGSDPYLYLDRRCVPGMMEVEALLKDLRGTHEKRLVNSLWGRVVVDGAAVGAWGRAGVKLTIVLLPDVDQDAIDGIEREAQRISTPLGKPVRITWLRL